MTVTEIRTALTEVRDAVEAPPVDLVVFGARVRAERRRRTTGRVLVAAAAAAVVAVGGLAAAALPGGGGPEVASGPPQELHEPTHLTGLVVEGLLVTAGPAGYFPTDVPAHTVEWVREDMIAVTDDAGTLVFVPVDDGGIPGEPREPFAVPVDHVWVDEDASFLVAQDQATGELLSYTPGGTGLTLRPSERTLVDIDHLPAGDVRLESDPSGLTLDSYRGERSVGSAGGVTGQDLAGDTLVLEGPRSVRFFDVATGKRFRTIDEPATGALSPDGTLYAATLGDSLSLVRPEGGDPTRFGPEGGLSDLFWTAPDTFVGIAHGDSTRSLWECRTDATCQELYVDPSETLQLSK